MPRWIRLTALWGNGIVTALWLLVSVVALSRNGNVALLTVAGAALGAFNLYVIAKAAHLLSEEEWLKGEVRKAELRQQLARLRAEELAGAPPRNADPLSLPRPSSDHT